MYKVMIADDEHIIRRGVVSLIDWEELGCEVTGEAANGSEACEYLQDEPVDILVCDIRMPGKSGLEVAEWIQREKIPVKIIFLTAYSDFEYARQALHYGVKDYVIKTDYIEMLPEAVRKVIAEIEKERHHAAEWKDVQGKLEDSMPMLQEKLIINLINGALQEEKEIGEQAAWCCFPMNPFYLVNFVFSTDSIWKIEEDRREKTMRAVRNFIHLSLSDYHVLTVPIKNMDFVAVIFHEKGNDAEEILFHQKLERDLSGLKTALRDTLNIEVNICVGELREDIQEMGEAYRSVHETNMRACFFDRHEIAGERTGEREAEPGNLVEKVRDILENLEQGFYGEAQADLEAFEEEIMTGKYSPETVKSRAIDICCVCRRILEKKEGDISGSGWCRLPEYQKISGCRRARELRNLLEEAMAAAAKAKEGESRDEYSPLVRECMEYIRLHYYERINIASAAESLHVNKSYLGTVFKKETGVSIVETITRYRLDKAMELMRQTEYKLFEISEKVGFEDPAYFTNVFIKYIGISPSAYRVRN